VELKEDVTLDVLEEKLWDHYSELPNPLWYAQPNKTNDMKKDVVIFDLDGTLALIDDRRKLSTKPNGKMDWDTFFDPDNIKLDLPNNAVIQMAKTLDAQGFTIVIFSGRSKATKDATATWLDKHDIPFNIMKMRPIGHPWAFMPDDKLKQGWLDDIFPGKQKDRILCIFDDRDKVVNMWRDNGLTCFQVAPGDF
jgi:acid phosphatase class B